MRVGIPKEQSKEDGRVALVPAMVGELSKSGWEILVETGSGDRAHFKDEQYQQAGARVLKDPAAIYRESDVILKVQPPGLKQPHAPNQLDLPREGTTLVGFLAPLSDPDRIQAYLDKKITAFSLELVPRITRAQGMDALSAMATLAGYKAVLLGASQLGKLLPLMMTAAGTIPPANVLILGAGVAGLQAIATAKRLGARVEAFDTRPAVKEQVESLGAQFVSMQLPEDAETKGGYAKELSVEFIQKEMEAIGARLPKIDMVITTAQVFGKKAPLLITQEMLGKMRSGSVVVDLAAEQGGNCELTKPGQVVVHNGVTIMGPLNLPATIATHASQMLSRNFTNILKHLYPPNQSRIDFNDEIVLGSCVCHNGELVSRVVKDAWPRGGNPS